MAQNSTMTLEDKFRVLRNRRISVQAKQQELEKQLADLDGELRALDKFEEELELAWHNQKQAR